MNNENENTERKRYCVEVVDNETLRVERTLYAEGVSHALAKRCERGVTINMSDRFHTRVVEVEPSDGE